ncbi:NAD(P)H-dependent oxidoreductase [Arthrobacter sp. NyZ413]|uniref:NAD(P)H-dependent oxidoreductase n=1 Tax=Arthrobacter sp. NyZ413 TaxID=3144669 RepID=UPI003BF874AD
MRTLIVSANPEADSLTNYAVERLKAELPAGSYEVLDLHTENFEADFTLSDRVAYQTAGNYPPDLRPEHERLERATELVLVFPVYWWSVPAKMKGWFDRVLVNGWAFEWEAGVGSVPKMQWLTTHMLPITATKERVWHKHGYDNALRTIMEHGLVEYCGMQRGVTAFVYESEDPESVGARVDQAVSAIVESILSRSGAQNVQGLATARVNGDDHSVADELSASAT